MSNRILLVALFVVAPSFVLAQPSAKQRVARPEPTVANYEYGQASASNDVVRSPP